MIPEDLILLAIPGSILTLMYLLGMFERKEQSKPEVSQE